MSARRSAGVPPSRRAPAPVWKTMLFKRGCLLGAELYSKKSEKDACLGAGLLARGMDKYPL
ncbi:UNVERIFIED_CONTAM: hypothetical protein Slati_0939700 [Sesamum latifolium]|uniref:Uncharacterized protein n=1 Tax=Sesamum latifolium TaxID=2727402 RepID=A0AAW2XR25_9LAMI